MNPVIPERQNRFNMIKSICDALMSSPSSDNIAAFRYQVCSLQDSIVQEMHPYLLFPLVAHLKQPAMSDKYNKQKELVDAMKIILERITIKSPDLFNTYHGRLLMFLYDKKEINKLIKSTEETKLSIMDCLTLLFLNVSMECRIKIYEEYYLKIAHTIFLAGQLAKTERLRALIKSSINCILCYTATHNNFTNSTVHITSKQLEEVVVDLVAGILPGVIAALQDVATSPENLGYAVIVLSLKGINRIVQLVMNDKYLKTKQDVSIEDFSTILQTKEKEKLLLFKPPKQKDVPRRSPEWFAMAGQKLWLVVKNLVSLQTHENVKVRKELAEFCGGTLMDCSRIMQPSIKYVLNMLITLSKDEYPEVSLYCIDVLDRYFDNISSEVKRDTLDKAGESFLENVAWMDRVLNGIDSSYKLAILHLLSNYVSILTVRAKPERLTTVLSQNKAISMVCAALVQAANVDTTVSLLAHATVKAFQLPSQRICPPWSPLPQLPSPALYVALSDLVQLMANSPAAELLADELINMLRDVSAETPAILRLLNWIGGAPNCPRNVTKRLVSKYIEHEFWYLPLEVGHREEPITHEESLDPDVYNPRAWERDSVPGLYEGATEVRYTGISYAQPRRLKLKDPNYCSTFGEARKNLVISCLLTEGVGLFAKRLGNEFQPYMMTVMCMILERVGSKHELIRMSGAKTLHEIAEVYEHADVAELIRSNSDYFTFQITMRLKRSWHNKSALEILTVVMEYSDARILDCLFGIVLNVLKQSCDKYHNSDLTEYLNVFLSFVNCIEKWFPNTTEGKEESHTKINVMSETLEYIKAQNEIDTAMKSTSHDDDEAFDEMFPKNDDVNDEDVKMVTDNEEPLPKHINMAKTITKLCINFIPSKDRDQKLLALQIINKGLQLLHGYDNEVLPLVHLIWSPLSDRFDEVDQPVVMRASFELLITMAKVSGNFIRARTMKDVIPKLKKFMHLTLKESYLKDMGSAYRLGATYKMQETILNGLSLLVVNLSLEDEHFDEILTIVDTYLSKSQPKPLQVSAVKFFRTMLEYDRGSVWYHLRKICNNGKVLEPPSLPTAELNAVIGTPYETADKYIDKNIKAIFDVN